MRRKVARYYISNFNDKFSFNVSSAKMFLWWMTNSDTANGVFATNALNQAITQTLLHKQQKQRT